MGTTWRELYVGCSQELGDRFDARVMIEELARQSFAELALHMDDDAPSGTKYALDRMVTRRRKGEPLQHVVGNWQFRTVDLAVDGRALIPRFETEVVVERALVELRRLKGIASSLPLVVVDLGTGSGAIACAIVSEQSAVEVLALDVSASALTLAKENGARLSEQERARLCFIESDVYGAIVPSWEGRIALIVSNPPYLTEREWDALEPVVRDFDPKSALVAGETGLEMIETVIAGAPRLLISEGALVLEIAAHQGEGASLIARRAGAREVEVAPDLAGRDRVLVVRW